MDLSDSFEPPSVPQRYEHHSEMEFLPETPLDSNRSQKTNFEPFVHWQEQLLPISCIVAEDNLTVLKMELERAHQLLQYQQSAIHSLTENLTNCDLQLQHTQQELKMAQQACDRNSAKLTDAESICRDLKTQLRRQQQRVLQYRNLLNEQAGNSLGLPLSTPSFQETVVSFGYEAATLKVETQQPVASRSQRPAVAAWSAPDSIDLTGPLACYRKLATIRMTTSLIRLESGVRGSLKTATVNHSAPPHALETHRLETNHLEPIEVSSKQSFRIDLPSFTKSSAKS